MGESGTGVFQIETAERARGPSASFLGDRLEGSDLERADFGLVFEGFAAHRPTAALPADAAHQRRVVRTEFLARVFTGLGDLAGRMDADLRRRPLELGMCGRKGLRSGQSERAPRR